MSHSSAAARYQTTTPTQSSTPVEPIRNIFGLRLCATRFGGADLIIDVENGIPYFSPLWRRGPSVCLVCHVHTDQWKTRFPAPVAAIARAVENRVMPTVYRHRLFVAISPSTANALEVIGIDPDHIRTIECGVDIPSGPLPAKSDEPLFVSLSRLVPHKRVDLLLDAWRIAADEI